MIRVTTRKLAEGCGETRTLFAFSPGEELSGRKRRSISEPEPVDPEASQVLRNFKNKKANKKAKEYIEGTKAQYPSERQVNYLAQLLGYPGRTHMESFVRFSNGYFNGLITRVHYVEAINMALKGYNRYYSASTGVRMSWDFQDGLDDNKDDLTGDTGGA